MRNIFIIFEKNKVTAEEKLKLLTEEFIKKDSDYNHYTNFHRIALESLYMTKVGNLKLELFELQIKIKTLHFKIEECHKAINRNECPNITLIEAKAIIEMAELQEQINQQTSKIKLSHLFLQQLTPVEDWKEVRDLYFSLSKKLHPDVVTEFTEQHKLIWEKVQNAYENKDLKQLQTIQIIYQDLLSNHPELNQENTDKKIETLIEHIKKIESEMQGLKNEFPYNLEESLDNEFWIDAENEKTQTEINIHLAYLENIEQEYQILANGN